MSTPRQRRCPACGRKVWARAGVIEKHSNPRWIRKQSGDYFCGAEGLRLISTKPVRWGRS